MSLDAEIEGILTELDPRRRLAGLGARIESALDPDREHERAYRARLEARHLENVTSKPVAVDPRQREHMKRDRARLDADRARRRASSTPAPAPKPTHASPRAKAKPTPKTPAKPKGSTAVNHAQPNRRALEAERARLLAVIAQNKRALAEQRAAQARAARAKQTQVNAVDEAFARIWPGIDPAMADRCQGIVSLGLDGFALMRDGSKIAISDLAGG